MVSALPQRAENKLHVSLMENYPGTLEALGEPIRQVGAVELPLEEDPSGALEDWLFGTCA